LLTQEVLRALHSHLGAQVAAETSSALRVLLALSQQHTQALVGYAAFLTNILDYIDTYTDAQVHQVGVATSAAATSALTRGLRNLCRGMCSSGVWLEGEYGKAAAGLQELWCNLRTICLFPPAPHLFTALQWLSFSLPCPALPCPALPCPALCTRLDVQVTEVLPVLPNVVLGALPSLEQLSIQRTEFPRLIADGPEGPRPAASPTLPASWATSLPHLKALLVNNLNISGSLPRAWLQKGGLPSLNKL